MEAQLMGRNGWSRRSLRSWMIRAITSLPEPVSPRMSTDISYFAACRARSRASLKRAESPTIFGAFLAVNQTFSESGFSSLFSVTAGSIEPLSSLTSRTLYAPPANRAGIPWRSDASTYPDLASRNQQVCICGVPGSRRMERRTG